MELFRATTITRKIILEGGVIAVDDGSRSGSGSGSGAVVGSNDPPLTIFETTSHYGYDHTSCADSAISSECSTCKCQDCKAKHNGMINAINALTAFVKGMTSNRGVILSKRISYPYTPLEIKVRTDWSTIEAYLDKMGNPFDVQYIEGIAQQTISSLNCGPFVTSYPEYLSDGLQVPNDGLDIGLLHKRYVALLWKYGEVKAQNPYASDTKYPRRPKPNSVIPDEEQLFHIY
ncbi:hypothetical protein T459_17039 [Capsicum annuum]|uniref:Ubiquitin-like protease family profile domain-containing protein n=1 Tax=Capsicum annuum TaxID=4072 RepID=A0A2G2ZAE6_CAPAN|nr:hypothetical protein T459_17039 [Capsicum annuum]